MENKPPPSLLTILALVELKPDMYLDGEEPSHVRRLDNLEMLISGYFLATHQHQLRDEGVELYSHFSEYLNHRFGWSANQGPIKAIRHAATSDAEAWQSFWILLREFRQSRGDAHG
jgi:hypothetical protein